MIFNQQTILEGYWKLRRKKKDQATIFIVIVIVNEQNNTFFITEEGVPEEELMPIIQYHCLDGSLKYETPISLVCR